MDVARLAWAPADLGLGKGSHRCEGFCIQLLNPLLDSEEAILQTRKLESRHWLDGAAVSCLPYQLWAPFRMSAIPDILWLALVVHHTPRVGSGPT